MMVGHFDEVYMRSGLTVNEDKSKVMTYDRNEWQEFVRRNAWGTAWGMNP